MRFHKSAALAVAAATLTAATTHAAVIQGSGETFVAFEAENFDSLVTSPAASNNWTLVDDVAGASGGSVLEALPLFTSNDDDADTFASYTITFAEAGTYTLYARRASDGNGQNAFFAADDFDVVPTGGDFTNFDNANVNSTGTGFVYASTTASGDPLTYEVEAGDVGVPLTFYAKPREGGYDLDRLVLARDGDLTDAELDALPNSTIPEPGAALALVGAGLLGLRRRR